MKLTWLSVVVLSLMVAALSSAGMIASNSTGGANSSGSGGAGACGFGGSPAYCNGPLDGNTDAWGYNFGFAVADSFNISTATTVSSVQIMSWLFPGDVLSNVDWSIGTNPFTSDMGAGAGQDVSLVSDLGNNRYGYDLQIESFNLGSGVALAAGTYYLTLQNGVIPSGNPVYWDQNDGPSMAFNNGIGNIPSESFAIYGRSASIPEPGTLVLGVSGLLPLIGALRRKLNR
jgi:hypothetical protein